MTSAVDARPSESASVAEGRVPPSFTVTTEIEAGAPPRTVTYTLYYITQDAEVSHLLAWLHQQTAIGLDLETGGLDVFTDGLATMQLGNPLAAEPRAYVLCLRSLSLPALQPVLAVLADRRILKIGQNIKFECRWIEHHLGVRVQHVACTQVTEMVLRSGLLDTARTKVGQRDNDEPGREAYRHTSMERLCKLHLGVQINKDFKTRTSFYDTPPGKLAYHQLVYAADDVVYPFYLLEKQREELTARALKSIIKIEWELIPILAHAELRGFYFDALTWVALWQEACRTRQEVEAQLDALFQDLVPQTELFGAASRPVYANGKELKYNTSAHVIWAIQQYCQSIRWPRELITTETRLAELMEEYAASHLQWRREKEPNFPASKAPEHFLPEDRYCILTSIDKQELKLRMLRGQLPRELVQLLLTYSQAQKRVATGMKFMKANLHPDGTIKTEFHQALTGTGRISTTPNIQNVDKDPRYRACFRARPGYKLVIADYSAIEPRISAEVTQDPTYVTTFVTGDDIYCSMGETLTGERPNMAAEDPEEHDQAKAWRQRFKTVVLSKAYRAGAAKLRDQMTLNLEKAIMSGVATPPTIEEARELDALFKERCARIIEYQDACERLANPLSERKIWDKFLGAAVTWIEAPCGRKRFFPPDATGTFTESPNAPIQGCSATMMKAAACLVEREITAHQLDAHVVNLVHDEGVWEVRADQALHLAQIVKTQMEVAGRYYVRTVPVIAAYPDGSSTGVVDVWCKEASEDGAEAAEEVGHGTDDTEA